MPNCYFSPSGKTWAYLIKFVQVLISGLQLPGNQNLDKILNSWQVEKSKPKKLFVCEIFFWSHS
jgi:hypothetical protein